MPRPMLKRTALLLPLLASCLAAPACRSPVPPSEAEASPAPRSSVTPVPDTAPVQQPIPPPAAAVTAEAPEPSEQAAPAEETAEETTLRLLRGVLATRGARLDEPVREQLAEVLLEAERTSGLPVLLLVALIEQESRFDPQARGPRGSLGLMQVRPFVGKAVAARIGITWAGRETLLDPVLNVRIGTRYLAEQLERFGSPEMALAAYNMGPSRLARRLARGDQREPAFVGRVLRHYEGMQQEVAATETGIGG